MPFVVTDGSTRIHYEIRGATGSDVVLIQGLGLSSRFWFDIPDRLARDPAGPYRVILLDNRGVGRSTHARGPYRMARLADDVVAVLDAAGARSAFVVGISLGGMIAQHVALRHPKRVAGLVLLATTPGLPHGRLPRLDAMAALVSLPFTRNPLAVARLLVPRRHLPRARELFAGWPAAMRADPVRLRIFFAQLLAAARHSTGARLSQIRCPTVVMTGAEDLLVPPENSDVLARGIPHARLEVLPDVGHAIPVLDVGAIARALASTQAFASNDATS